MLLTEGGSDTFKASLKNKKEMIKGRLNLDNFKKLSKHSLSI
jgi:hypothetical protein